MGYALYICLIPHRAGRFTTISAGETIHIFEYLIMGFLELHIQVAGLFRLDALKYFFKARIFRHARFRRGNKLGIGLDRIQFLPGVLFLLYQQSGRSNEQQPHIAHILHALW